MPIHELTICCTSYHPQQTCDTTESSRTHFRTMLGSNIQLSLYNKQLLFTVLQWNT